MLRAFQRQMLTLTDLLGDTLEFWPSHSDGLSEHWAPSTAAGLTAAGSGTPGELVVDVFVMVVPRGVSSAKLTSSGVGTSKLLQYKLLV